VVVGCCEHGDEPSGSGIMEFVHALKEHNFVISVCCVISVQQSLAIETCKCSFKIYCSHISWCLHPEVDHIAWDAQHRRKCCKPSEDMTPPWVLIV
jgi:hypothetical protein